MHTGSFYLLPPSPPSPHVCRPSPLSSRPLPPRHGCGPSPHLSRGLCSCKRDRRELDSASQEFREGPSLPLFKDRPQIPSSFPLSIFLKEMNRLGRPSGFRTTERASGRVRAPAPPVSPAVPTLHPCGAGWWGRRVLIGFTARVRGGCLCCQSRAVDRSSRRTASTTVSHAGFPP